MKELVLLNPYKRIVLLEVGEEQFCNCCEHLIPAGCKAIQNRYEDKMTGTSNVRILLEYVCQECNRVAPTGSIPAHRYGLAWLEANPCEGPCLAVHYTADMRFHQ